ncbi:relaxase/mobilization nuclease domain-containing protein [Phocaeicola sp.]|uniref:relaxase/mobilization nuclease domain-containing protein n=1 Tax=Phocaeicola sp. TaxID=2773926 RepID=UPI003AB619DB
MINRVVVWIVFEYMKKMGLPNMLFFIAHHFDKEHPHVHITLIVLLMMAELSQVSASGYAVFIYARS